jgi:nucleotide-binding universal stress UspA family protein
MIDVRRVLTAVDFSESSRRALDYAIAIAKWYGSPLTVLHVRTAAAPAVAPLPVLVPSGAEAVITSASEQEHWRHQLEAFVPTQATKDIRVDCTVTEGDVATEILAQAQPSDLIVIGTHGRSGLEHLVLGSVAEKILRAAPGALLTIPRLAPDATRGVPGLFHHVVAAVDFSAASMRALEYALALAEEADAQLTLLHVVHMPEQPALWIDRDDRASVVVELQEKARERLAALVPNALRRYCHVAVRVEAGEPACEIVRVATEGGAGLVVLGAHSRGVAERIFVGSTAQQVVRQATFPVLTVRETSQTEKSDQV